MKKNQANLAQRLVQQYLLTLLALAGVLIVFAYGMRRLCLSKIWYGNERWYPLLSRINENFMDMLVIVCLSLWLFVTIVFAVRIWLYLREVIIASERMALYTDRPVRMSAGLKEVQDELNNVRLMVQENERRAKEAEQRKNDLIVYLAHDLKTPLTSVTGYLTLLRDEPQLPQELRARYTGIAYEKALRLEQLINEFFDITRLNLTTIVLEKQPVKLDRMLEQLASEFLPVMEEKNLRWQLSLQPEVVISCDPDKLQRVFDNLIRNACFYSYPDSGISLYMAVVDGRAFIRLENPGRTIPPEKLSRIFEQFYRLDDSRSTSTGGAGLGLAIAKEIVVLHGGHIEAESENGRVVFCVWLPL
ncbi:MAG: HAMP domain-containing histidine kinase [Muribaculaceae bacterium]|nr:HAMP domain-containing histidine kinase [Roseburia sp.]MCM1431755.1 HAMP domain-containing histidine kinase [Muribaculaceae bacterium]MCM1493379.1 HAMP domain-containing histidine kinase [Muribaculaceae bacterium]